MMDDNKTKIIRFLLGQMPVEEKEEFEKTISAKSKEKDLLKKYKQIIDQIDQNYARKIISEELAESHFIDQEEVSIENTKTEVKLMKKASSNWIQYLMMILISLIISFFVFFLFGPSDKENAIAVKKEKAQAEQTVDTLKTDNKLISDDAILGTNIMGIAINKTGFYLLPYSVVELKGVFGSNRLMSNNLPLIIMWDDKELGLAVAEMPNENLGKMPSIPYSFSKNDFFLGEDLFFVYSTKSKMIVNRGMVVEDSPGAYSMKVHLNLDSEVYGAVVLDDSGEVIGICEKRDKDGNVKVIKSIALFQMVKEMNADKGLTYISLPNQNSLRSKSNAQRIESLSPFMVWFSTK